jgi:hypothetical protein
MSISDDFPEFDEAFFAELHKKYPIVDLLSDPPPQCLVDFNDSFSVPPPPPMPVNVTPEAATAAAAAAKQSAPPAAATWPPPPVHFGKMAAAALEIIAAKGGTICSAPKKKGTRQRIWVRCAKLHLWEADMDRFVYQDSWCPKCREEERRRSTEEWSRATGIVPLGPYKKSKQKRQWRCPAGHVFEIAFEILRRRQTGYCRLCR